MFIPKTLLELIDKYNEKGILFKFDTKVIWFNGKRFEHWYHHFGLMNGKILYYRSKLYFKQLHFIYTNGIWLIKSNGLWEWIEDCNEFKKLHHPLANLNHYYQNDRDYKVKANKHLYRVTINGAIIIDKNLIGLLRYYNGFIYSFDNFEKFELKTEKKTNFSECPITFQYRQVNIEILNNLFYLFFRMDNFICYNPLTDTWQDLMQIKF